MRATDRDGNRRPSVVPKVPSVPNYARGLAGPGGNASMDPRASAPKPQPKPQKSSAGAINYLLDTLTGRKKTPTPVNPLTGHPVTPAAPKAAPKTAPKKAAPVAPKAPIVSSSSAYRPKPSASPVGSAASATAAPRPVTTTPAPGNVHNLMQSFIDQAKSSVNAEDLPALNDLQRQLNRLNAEGEAASMAAGQRGQVVEQGTKNLYDQLVAFSQAAKGTNDAAAQTLQQNTGQGYDQLIQQIGGNFDSARQGVQSELARLGLSGQSPDATGGLARDQAFLTSLAGVDKNAATSGLANSQQGFDQLMSMILANQQHEGVSRQADAKAQTQNELAQLSRALFTGRSDIEGKRGDIKATQGQRIDQLARALEEKDYTRRTDESDRSFSRQMAEAELGLKLRDQGLQEAAASAGPSYSDQLDVALKQARLDQLLNPAAAGGKAAKLTPEQRAKQILHAALDNPSNPSAPTNMTDLWNIINTLRLGTYDDNHNKIPDIQEGRAKFDVNNPAMLAHLQYALKNRFGNTNNQGTALDIIRALTGKL